MKVGQALLLILVAGLIAITYAVGADVNAEWKQVNELDGIIGYTRPSPLTSINEIKAIGTVDAPVASIEALVRDLDSMKNYLYRCSEAFPIQIPGIESGKDNYYIYYRTNLPWPVYDRDVVVKAEARIDKESGAILIQTKKISSDFRKKKWGVVRMPIFTAKCILTPTEGNKTKVTYQILLDPGGYLPSFIVNMLSKNAAVEIIANFRKIMKDDKYKKAKSVITTTPWIR